MARKDDDVAEISEKAWDRLSEAIKTGLITTGVKIGVELSVEQYIDLCKWAAGVKIKKPQVVAAPEDFVLSHTGDKDE